MQQQQQQKKKKKRTMWLAVAHEYACMQQRVSWVADVPERLDTYLYLPPKNEKRLRKK